MNCIIVDDEPLAHEVLNKYIQKIPYLQLQANCFNAYDASTILQEQNIDLIFLDIQMPDISGLTFIETINTNKISVILTTAYSEFAIEGFEKNVLDYLLKPISPERFLQAVTKAKELFDLKQQQTIQVNKTFMFVKVEYQMIKINFSDILYIEGLKDYVKIYTKKEMILTLLNIKNIYEKLPKDFFIRVHKSYIVNIEAIEKIDRLRIIFGEKYIPIGLNYKEEFYKTIGK